MISPVAEKKGPPRNSFGSKRRQKSREPYTTADGEMKGVEIGPWLAACPILDDIEMRKMPNTWRTQCQKSQLFSQTCVSCSIAA